MYACKQCNHGDLAISTQHREQCGKNDTPKWKGEQAKFVGKPIEKGKGKRNN